LVLPIVAAELCEKRLSIAEQGSIAKRETKFTKQQVKARVLHRDMAHGL